MKQLAVRVNFLPVAVRKLNPVTN